MHFIRPEIDSPLLTELYSHQVISQAAWNSFQKPGEGTLTEVLRDNADHINAQGWAYWLVKRHGFIRIPNLKPDRAFFKKLRWPAAREKEALFYGYYPVSIRGSVAHMVCLRPEVKKHHNAILDWLGVTRIFFFALTPQELGRWENCIRIPL